MNGNLYTHIQNNVGIIKFGHPAGNSFPKALLESLTNELDKLSDNDAVSVIILKSEGDRTFCAGASFDELMAIETPEQGIAFFSGFANVINAMRSSTKMMIGCVQGKAVGGGVGLIAACDYVFATKDAAIKLSEFTIGIGPFVIAPAVERKIGIAGLSELTVAGHEWKSAYWAKEKGLYAAVFETQKEMESEAEALSMKLASYNPASLEEMKKVFWKGTDNWNSLLKERAAISGSLVLSDFTKKALQKFKK
ncbi:MAG: enoyl-CoA hydratase/isomerase family protein [Flavobacteriaceae bacterium]|nr:MAG: enoyl-CoA hydratase/isomerase family protein [Flavobacteriaceae bacterium]